VQDPSQTPVTRRRLRRLPQGKRTLWRSTSTLLFRGRTSRRNKLKPSMIQSRLSSKSWAAPIAKIEYWGLRTLTYRIKKNRKGHYSLLAIDAPVAGRQGVGAPAVDQ